MQISADEIFERAIQAHQSGRFVEARRFYDTLLNAFPDVPVLLLNKGILEFEHGDLSEGVALLERARHLTPDSPNLLMNLGAAYIKQRRLNEAVEVLKQSLALDPSQIEAHSNLGESYRQLGQLDLASQPLQHALKLLLSQSAPVSANLLPAVQFNLSQVVRDNKEGAELAVSAWRCSPENLKFACNAAGKLSAICDFDKLEPILKVIKQAKHNPASFADTGIIQHYFDGFDGVTLRKISEAYCNFTYTYVASSLCTLNTQDIHSIQTVGVSAQPRLRIGYILADARNHANGYNTMQIMTAHDRNRFEVFVYSTGVNDLGMVRKHIESGSEHFIDLYGQDDLSIAQRIADDRIHVLIDLMGHTDMNRLHVLAHRPAAVQMTWLGFPGTTGAPFIDYIIGDPIVTPLNLAEDFSEKIAQLPHCYQANNHRMYELSPPPPREALGLPPDDFVFCCLNNLNKITRQRFRVWMSILQACPKSVLWLRADSEVARKNLMTEAARQDVDASRLCFSKSADRKDYLNNLQVADLFLDTAPYGAHTTATDALWAGVPVLTILGNTFASRVCASLVTTAGIPEMVMQDEAAYRNQAIAWYQNPVALSSIRHRLLENRANSPLFDSALSVRSLEDVYLRAWKTYLDAE